MYRGRFKTAYLQREVPEVVAVLSNDNLMVGCLVRYSAAGTNSIAYIEPVTANSVKEALAEATHMIAQADVTMSVLKGGSYDHVPVELQDYRYNNVLAKTVTIGTAGKKFLGTAATVAELKTKFASATEGDAAYVEADGNVYKAPSGGGSGTWVEDTGAKIDSKRVAMFALIDKNDVEVIDVE